MASSRKTYDARLKERVALAVQSGELTVKAASDKYEVQPFQVLAWIGEYTLMKKGGSEQPETSAATRTPTSPGPDVHTGDTGLMRALSEETASGSIDPSLAQAVGEWYLRNRLPKKLAKADGKSGNKG